MSRNISRYIIFLIIFLSFFSVCAAETKITSIDIQMPDGTICTGKTISSDFASRLYTVKAVVEPETAQNLGVAWNSSNPDVATISTDGLITYVGGGETTIIAAAGIHMILYTFKRFFEGGKKCLINIIPIRER